MSAFPTHDRQPAVLLLLAIAGCVDAVGLAELGRYFTSFMSGNTTLAGLALAYGDTRGVAMPLGLVALFVAGAIIGTLLMEKARHAGPGLVLLLVGAMLAAAALAFSGPRPAAGIVLLPVAMGIANLVSMHNGAVSTGATYASGTLVRIGVRLARLGRGANARALLYDLAIWVALLVGAVAGAFGRLRYGTTVLLVPGAMLAVLGAIDLLVSLRGARMKASMDGR